MKHVVSPDGDVAHGAAEAARVIDIGQRPTHQIHRPEITATSRALCRYFSKSRQNVTFKAQFNSNNIIRQNLIKLLRCSSNLWPYSSSLDTDQWDRSINPKLNFDQYRLECFLKKTALLMYPQGYPDVPPLQLQLGSDKNVRKVKFAVMQGMDITIQELWPLLHLHAH